MQMCQDNCKAILNGDFDREKGMECGRYAHSSRKDA